MDENQGTPEADPTTPADPVGAENQANLDNPGAPAPEDTPESGEGTETGSKETAPEGEGDVAPESDEGTDVSNDGNESAEETAPSGGAEKPAPDGEAPAGE